MASEKSGSSSSKKQSTPTAHASTSGASSSKKQSTPTAHASTSGSSNSSAGSSKKVSTPTAHASTSWAGSGSSNHTTDKTTGGQSTKLRTDVVLPQTKIRVIMKSSPEIDSIGADSVFLITKATELFIDHLTTTAYGTCKGNKNLQYKNLAEVVHRHQNLEFLRDIIPIKMSARAALAEVAKQKHFDEKELFE